MHNNELKMLMKTKFVSHIYIYMFISFYLCIFNRAKSLSHVCVTVDLKNIFKCRRAEKNAQQYTVKKDKVNIFLNNLITSGTKSCKYNS